MDIESLLTNRALLDLVLCVVNIFFAYKIGKRNGYFNGYSVGYLHGLFTATCIQDKELKEKSEDEILEKLSEMKREIVQQNIFK